MKPDRITRINERVREELSAALYRVGPGDGVEAGRISFVSAKVSPDLHNAIVEVSILGDEAQARTLMSWLRGHRADFQRHLADTVGLKYTPVLDFRRTEAIEKGSPPRASYPRFGGMTTVPSFWTKEPSAGFAPERRAHQRPRIASACDTDQ